MRLVLVPTAARPECAVALDVAFGLAKRLEASVKACHVRAERHQPPRSAAAADVEDLYERVAAAAAENANLTSSAAQELFQKIATSHGFRIAHRTAVRKDSVATWHDMVGTPERVLGIVGPVADLAVLSRPKPKSAGTARTFLLAALMHSARPVLIVPQRRVRSLGSRVVIAWNQSADAAIAVAAALPLLQRAKRVVVVASGAENRPGPKSSYLAQYLAHWDVEIERVRTKGRDVEREIEDAYRNVDGDLLVMGAYSRHWFRERVFGGVTEHMLFKTDIPVLMLHR
jgi:nucleotide-binding universal stress UspA family protein